MCNTTSKRGKWGVVRGAEHAGGETPTPDRTVGPSHYTEMAIQPWDVMEACMPRAEFLGYLRGNAIKYLMRADRKGGVEDYRKAKHYLEKLVSVLNEQM